MALRDPWLRTTEVAERLGVSAETVRRMIRSQSLRATALVRGQRVTFRIRQSDFDRFRATYVKDTATDDWE